MPTIHLGLSVLLIYKDKKMRVKKIRKIEYLFAIIIWIGIWQVFSIRVDRMIFLPSPFEVGKAFLRIGKTGEFYASAGNSLLHVFSGFFLAVIVGSLLAVLSFSHRFFQAFLQVPIKLIQATPVASFTILALVWISSKHLSILVSFLMVFPTITINVKQGLLEADQKLLEMAQVYHMSYIRKIRYIYLPAVMPYFLSACSIGVGMSWKSGIAAEVIGITKHSIGNQLYQAKLYLMTPELFAWTFVIVFISLLVEYGVVQLIGLWKKQLEGTTEEEKGRK